MPYQHYIFTVEFEFQSSVVVSEDKQKPMDFFARPNVFDLIMDIKPIESFTSSSKMTVNVSTIPQEVAAGASVQELE